MESTKMSLSGKVAVVTGASSGIGAASAIQLAKAGASVALLDLKEEKAEKIKQEIEKLGSKAIIVDVDLSDPDRVDSGIKQVMSEFGRLDIVFANAGINGVVTPIEDFDPEEWDHTLTTNLKSTFLTVKYSIPHLKANGGSIIITSSINGNRKFSGTGMSAYSSSKAGQMAFGKMAALELAPYKIRVNIICPGAIETNIGENTHPEQDKLQKVKIPVKYPEGSHPLEDAPGQPEQVADLIHFLASNASSHITGSEIYIDGAETLL
ncbi:SDR family oxidoreductase [Lederbergia galactosidilytica]|uniref:3-ketoacyl-ACP reductase n=1 Tax=Lederbergia galactosidilytica TaxID=217031 RepID=A0A0Q9Y1U0_9BACI|nr:SDR family NAD(P)-dependent oxidoreductase [Lederbergia galactosidilytica]KRG10898.1 3-ketoacyl-ACP reductase [Lederbergia galactosidilytica]KRG16000.1 3-ketoacyl-ACP reductase [Virgibacillus soli]OAK67689.1 3-ketoacyl-ACP reductase [Lederbergia galactosidilytica]